MRSEWLMAAVVTVAFAGLARLLRGVGNSGAAAGALVCFALYACAGPGAFAALACVFALTWSATRIGYQRKFNLGVAEKRTGRNASQVLANLSAAAACAIAFRWSGREFFLVGMAAALAEAAADTVSSEIGQASGNDPHLITTWEQVSAGTDGGVSMQGTLAGIAAAGIIGATCAAIGLLPSKQAGIAAVAGVVGSVGDSYLGALLERRQKLNNDLVNLLATLMAAGIGLMAAKLANH